MTAATELWVKPWGLWFVSWGGAQDLRLLAEQFGLQSRGLNAIMRILCTVVVMPECRYQLCPKSFSIIVIRTVVLILIPIMKLFLLLNANCF